MVFWLTEDHTYEGYHFNHNGAEKTLLHPYVIEQCLIHMFAVLQLHKSLSHCEKCMLLHNEQL